MASPALETRRRMLIIGAGFSGIGLGIRLRQQGIHDFAILERATDVGGTWRDNTYPGCACDVQSALYSFAFAPNPDWTRTFAPQSEIWAYLKRCAVEYGVEQHIAFGQEVTSAAWSDATREWTVQTPTHAWHASMLVLAAGPLSEPAFPNIPGLETFGGRVFHSARWDHGHSLSGKRVAVIGTGASAVQFIPQIQPLVQTLHVFQRTPPWIVPRRDRAISAWRRWMYRRLPFTQRAARGLLYALREGMGLPFRHPRLRAPLASLARWHMTSHVSDPALRAKLTPRYAIGCKRILVSDDFYPAIARPNVELVTASITAIAADGIDTNDGRTHSVDTIILGTGFHVTDTPTASRIAGRNGISLTEAWRGSPTAYRGTMTAGFPNLFLLLGPNTGLGHSSVVLMAEAQIEHLLQLLRWMEIQGAGVVEPRAEAQETYQLWLDGANANTVWNAGGCRSWYLDVTGRNSVLWPSGVGRFHRLMSHLEARDYTLSPSQPRAS